MAASADELERSWAFLALKRAETKPLPPRSPLDFDEIEPYQARTPPKRPRFQALRGRQ